MPLNLDPVVEDVATLAAIATPFSLLKKRINAYEILSLEARFPRGSHHRFRGFSMPSRERRRSNLPSA